MHRAAFLNTMKNSSNKIILFITTVVSFITPFMGSSINIALPAIGKEFGLNAILLGWIATSYLLSAAVFLVPFGKIADIYGRKKIFTMGVVIYSVSSFLAAISQTVLLLILSRVLQGIGGAMIFGIGVAILTSVFPGGERGRVLGINSAAVYIGLSMGPVIGGFLTQHFGWRSIFTLNAIIGLSVTFLILWKMKGEWKGPENEKFDFTGSVIYAIMLIAIIYGFSSLPATLGWVLILTGILCLYMLIIYESSIINPLLNIKLFRNNAVFAFSNLAALINYSATFAVGFLLSLYLQYIKGYYPREAGMVLMSQPIIMAIFSPFAGKLSDKIESKLIASAGMAFTVAGLILLSFLNDGSSLWFILTGLIIIGFGTALFSSPNTNAVMGSVERNFYGVASATLSTMRIVGQMLSIGIAMLIFAVLIGRVQITPACYKPFLSSMRIAFVIFSILCTIGIFASLARGNNIRNQ